MPHTFYYELEADTHREFGLALGRRFGEQVHSALSRDREHESWGKRRATANQNFVITKRYFPQYIEEIEGYAQAAQLPVLDLWTTLFQEVHEFDACTSVVTQYGTRVGHNEDGSPDAQDSMCVLKKRVGSITHLELFYFASLGGVSASMNSHGVMMCINTLDHPENNQGVPRKIIGRWLQDTQSIEDDEKRLEKIPRVSGYNHLFVTREGQIWNLECAASEFVFTTPRSPYAHTNHFLQEAVKRYERCDSTYGTRERYADMCRLMQPQMTVSELKTVLSDRTRGQEKSICNERTIARMVVDIPKRVASIWLKREDEKGWVDYPLNFIA